MKDDENKLLKLIEKFFWGLFVKIMSIILDIGIALFWDPFWDMTWGGVPDVIIDVRTWGNRDRGSRV